MFKKSFYIKLVLAIGVCYGVIYLYSSFHRSVGTDTQVSQSESRSDKLLLDVYMETRCPDTEIFVSDQLLPAISSLGDLLTLTLYPYGKAEEKFDGEKWIFSCQHGPKECTGNTILGCVISMINQSKVVPFTECLMRNLEPLTNYKTCCEDFKINTNQVEQCYKGKTGNDIQHMNAVATSSLVPKLKFIPWIVINKKFSESNQDKALSDLKGLLCSYLKDAPQCRT